MTVRAARFGDVPAIVAIMAEAKERSRYADCTFDPIHAKQALVRGIQRHGQRNAGASLVMVSERHGQLQGFMLGLLDSVYPFLLELRATDYLFIKQGGDLTDARGLIQSVLVWAEENPRVVEVCMGVTDAIGEWERTSKLYQRMGFEQCGAMFRMRFDRGQQEVRRVGSG